MMIASFAEAARINSLAFSLVKRVATQKKDQMAVWRRQICTRAERKNLTRAARVQMSISRPKNLRGWCGSSFMMSPP